MYMQSGSYAYPALMTIVCRLIIAHKRDINTRVKVLCLTPQTKTHCNNNDDDDYGHKLCLDDWHSEPREFSHHPIIIHLKGVMGSEFKAHRSTKLTHRELDDKRNI